MGKIAGKGVLSDESYCGSRCIEERVETNLFGVYIYFCVFVEVMDVWVVEK